MWLENHAINKIPDGQAHAYPLGILNVDWNLLNSKSTHHLPATRVPPGTCYNIFCKIDTVFDSVFAPTSSSSRLSTGPKTFVVHNKHQWRWWWSCLWWCFSCFSALCISWASWYSAYPPSPRVAASAACASMWCVRACAGSTFSSCFSYCCKKKRNDQ